MLDVAARLLLETRPDGSVAGRTPVNDSHYRVMVTHEKDSGRTILDTADGPVELGTREAASILRDAGREDLASDIDENSGPLVPPELRDQPTTPELRRAILARDRYRCLCCGDRDNLTIHHKHWRRYGGRTVPRNLFTFCEDCHSLTHDGLIVVRGTIPGGLRFLGPDGRELDGRGAVDGLLLSVASNGHQQGDARAACEAGDARAAREVGDAHTACEAGDARAARGQASILTFDALPERVDTKWCSRHGHLLRWDDRAGNLDFQPGSNVPGDDARAARGADDARAAPSPTLAGMVGQQRVVKRLSRAVAAAARRAKPVPHILLGGPPGLGKTSLARAVAAELGTGFHRVSAPVVKEPGVLLRLLTCLQERDVLFIDEINRLPPAVTEALYEAMAEGSLSLPVRCGSQQRTLHVRLQPFTLIGATTEDNLIPEALRARFVIREELEFYRPDELAELLQRAASAEGFQIHPSAAESLAAAARDTPREALALLQAARDEVVLAGGTTIDAACACAVLAAVGIDVDGLRPPERRYLEVLSRAGRPLGVATIAGRLGVSRGTVECVCEPYLLRRELIQKTPYGRVLS